MFKETLHNLARHAHATHVRITLTKQDGHLVLRVEDNGCGFDPANSSADGMGLQNLKRRAAKHAGRVAIESARGCGTKVAITLPLHD